MQGIAPPYALDATPFRFPALASCAGRAPLGGDRDLALGVYTAARLAQALLPPIKLDAGTGQPPPPQAPTSGYLGAHAPTLPPAASRAERAKTWLSGLTMPQPARMAILRAFDATADGPNTAANAIAELALTVTGHIDAPSQQELSDLVDQLRLYYEQHHQSYAAHRETPRESPQEQHHDARQAERGSHGRP